MHLLCVLYIRMQAECRASPPKSTPLACVCLAYCVLAFLVRRSREAPTTKREMRTPDSSDRRCRIWRAPTPASVVLVLLLVIISSSSSSHVADGVRTTPRASGPGDAGGVLDDDAEAPAAAAGAHHASSRRATYRPADRTTDDEGSVVVEEEDQQQWWLKAERAATGSRLPDCAHACGPCSPCRRVIVSFRCALASESCPLAYRCMCRGRFFRVPSL